MTQMSDEIIDVNVSATKTEEKPILRDEKGLFLPGTAAGPGRTEGSISIKQRVRKYLDDNPDKLDSFVKYFAEENRDLAWQMLEGRPQQHVDVDAEFQTHEIIRGNEDTDRLIQGTITSVASASSEPVEPLPIQSISGGQEST